MAGMNYVWLASYPRSGNTFLRTILWNCFGLRSASVYPRDLGSNQHLQDYVGHIEHSPQLAEIMQQTNGELFLGKTHELPKDDRRAIYITRDGRAASVSLWQFFDNQISLRDVIEGKHHFGTWCEHIAAWDPWNRPNTLLLDYEDLTQRLPETLEKLSQFLGRAIQSTNLPDRDDIAKVDGIVVKKKKDWRTEMSESDLQRFMEINQAMMQKLGYTLD
ncbi:MAG: sulfotransferase domain-containing protein [Oleiphilaceae bacterium]|nr:sulfotransferase domain-containing protein [Oleiphilaceae bacterium]